MTGFAGLTSGMNNSDKRAIFSPPCFVMLNVASCVICRMHSDVMTSQFSAKRYTRLPFSNVTFAKRLIQQSFSMLTWFRTLKPQVSGFKLVWLLLSRVRTSCILEKLAAGTSEEDWDEPDDDERDKSANGESIGYGTRLRNLVVFVTLDDWHVGYIIFNTQLSPDT